MMSLPSDSPTKWFDSWRRTNWTSLREVCDSALAGTSASKTDEDDTIPTNDVDLTSVSRIIEIDRGTLHQLSKEAGRLEKEYVHLGEVTNGAGSGTDNTYPSPSPSEDSYSSTPSAENTDSETNDDAKATPIINRLRKESAFLYQSVVRLRSDAEELEAHSNNLAQRANALFKETNAGAKQHAEETRRRKDRDRERRRNIGKRINAEKARLDQAKREAAVDEARWEAERESIPEGRRRHGRHHHHHRQQSQHSRETPLPSPRSNHETATSFPGLNLPLKWEEYEKTWDELTHARPGIEPRYTFKTFPWPVEPAPQDPSQIKIENISSFLMSSQHSGSKTQRERLHSALLKWHPDRASRWVNLVVESERADVQKGAAVVIRCLNQLMERA